MPKVHSASPLSCGLLKAGKVFVSSFVQTYKGSWRDMVHLPSIPEVVHRQDGGTAPSCQVLSAQALTRILGKNPIPESGPGGGAEAAARRLRACWLVGLRALPVPLALSRRNRTRTGRSRCRTYGLFGALDQPVGPLRETPKTYLGSGAIPNK